MQGHDITDRRFTVQVEVGADTLADLTDRLRDVAHRIEADGVRRSVGGGASGWHVFTVSDREGTDGF